MGSFSLRFPTDGSLSDTALNSSLLDCQLPGERASSSWSGRRGGPSSSASSSGGLAHSSSASQQQHYAKSEKGSGLSKKSNSTSQLSATGQSGFLSRQLLAAVVLDDISLV